MSAKELLIDFLNLVFVVLITGASILYFISGDNFETFKNLMQTLAPFGLFGLLLLITLRVNRRKMKKRRSENNMDMDLSLNFMDRMKIDIFIFSLPMVVCLVFWLLEKTMTMSIFLSACSVFILAYSFRWWLLSKEEY